MTTVLRLEHVTKNYGSLRALDDVTLHIGSGVTGLLGPNGAGKTTLIKVALGLVTLNEGQGEVLGQSLKSRGRAIRERVGFMPEDDCYIPGLSGVEMVQFMARLSGLPPTEGLRRSHEILDYCEIGQERYREVETYSTGMRQQLKFAQALVHDPALLILDEPTAGLDPEERQAMLARIRSLAVEDGKSVLVSTHILPDVQSVCDTVVIMVGGSVRLVEQLDVLQRPSAPTHHIGILSGNTGGFVERIQSEGYQVDPRQNGQITVLGLDDDSLEHVWRWAAETETTIKSLMPARNSLEDVFLQAIREAEDANP